MKKMPVADNPDPQTHDTALSLRLILAGVGAAAGMVFGVLFVILPDAIHQLRLLTPLLALAVGFFCGLLLLLGRLDHRKALICAVALLGWVPV